MAKALHPFLWLIACVFAAGVSPVAAYGFAPASAVCPTETRTCAQIQSLRATRAERFRANPNRFASSSAKSCLELQGQTVRELVNRDAQLITNALARKEIQTLPFSEMDELFQNPESHFNRWKRYLEQQEARQDYYRRYTLEGPILNLDNAYDNTNIFQQPVRQQLAQLSPTQRLRTLIRKMSERPLRNAAHIEMHTARDPFSPFVAKAILMEVLVSKLEPAEWAALLDQLQLRFDAFSPLMNQSRSTAHISVHNGYFLGSELEHTPTANFIRQGTSIGTDCTLMIQQCFLGTTHMPRDFRLLSNRLVALAMNHSSDFSSREEQSTYNSLFESTRYRCEEQLEPGDLIAISGHAFVFAGYETTSSGQWKIKTYEALGGVYRSVGESIREFYSEDDCSQPLFSTDDNGRPNRNERAYVIRLRRGHSSP